MTDADQIVQAIEILARQGFGSVHPAIKALVRAEHALIHPEAKGASTGRERCPSCEGEGTWPDQEGGTTACGTCKGTGKAPRMVEAAAPTVGDLLGLDVEGREVAPALPGEPLPLEAGDEQVAFDNWRRGQPYEGSPSLAAWKAWMARASRPLVEDPKGEKHPACCDHDYAPGFCPVVTCRNYFGAPKGVDRG